MSEHRDRWLAYGRKVDDLTRTPMRPREAEDHEIGYEKIDFSMNTGENCWHDGWDAGYQAALNDVQAAWPK